MSPTDEPQEHSYVSEKQSGGLSLFDAAKIVMFLLSSSSPTGDATDCRPPEPLVLRTNIQRSLQQKSSANTQVSMKTSGLTSFEPQELLRLASFQEKLDILLAIAPTNVLLTNFAVLQKLSVVFPGLAPNPCPARLNR